MPMDNNIVCNGGSSLSTPGRGTGNWYFLSVYLCRIVYFTARNYGDFIDGGGTTPPKKKKVESIHCARVRSVCQLTCPSVCPFVASLLLLSLFHLSSSADAQDMATNKHTDFCIRPNLNWLIHIAFARQDYKYCKEVIEYQFSETFDHEYLYYTKVR